MIFREKEHSFYGLISGLIFLFPLFPLFTLLPILSLGEALGEYFSNCEFGYRIAYIFSLVLIIIIDFLYWLRAIRKNITEKEGFGLIFFFNLLLYSLMNSFTFIIVVGTQNICRVDGQTILAAMLSGPVSSIAIFANGSMIDMVKYMINKSKLKE